MPGIPSMAAGRGRTAGPPTAAQAAFLGAVWRLLLIVAGAAIAFGAIADAVSARAAEPQRVAWIRYRGLGPPAAANRAAAFCVTGDFTPCAEPGGPEPAARARARPIALHPKDVRPCASARSADPHCVSAGPWRRGGEVRLRG